MNANLNLKRLSRRAFLHGSSLLLTTSALASSEAFFANDNSPLNKSSEHKSPLLRVGLLTDMHFADKDPTGTRHYVLGNHCVDMLTKEEFLGKVGQKESYYSFDHKGVHFIVLDACFRKDGKPYGRKNSAWDDANIPAAEIDWLRDDLKTVDGKVIVLAHQRLDGNNQHCVKNAAEVRSILEGSQKVSVVLQGHSHQNAYTEIGHIHYCTLAAMVEGSGVTNNSYTILDIHSDGTLHLRGFRRQKNYDWS